MMRRGVLRKTNSALACLAAAVLMAGCAGCSDDPETKDSGSVEPDDVADGTADGTADADAGVADSKVDEKDTKETLDTTDVATTADVQKVKDIGPPEDCTADEYCVNYLKDKTSVCQTAVCDQDSLTCKLIHKVGSCCNDGDCNDGAACTTDSCDPANNKCKNTLIPDCCDGKIQIADEGFEQKTLGDFTAKGGKDNGNVSWHIDPKRHHSGKNALYLGNDCYSYDNTQTATNNCTSSPAGGQPVIATLTSKPLNLPVGKVVIAHFWLWLDAEPKLTEQLFGPDGKTELLTPSGKPVKPALDPSTACSPKPCDAGHTCVKLPQPPKETCDPECEKTEICQGGKCITAAQCLPENDVLLIYIDVPGKKPAIVWDSSDLPNKSTAGWQHVAINVNKEAAGQKSVQLRWEFRTNNGNLNGFEGVWLDDIRVETICVEKDPPKFQGCEVGKKCPAKGNVCQSVACTPYALAKFEPKAGVCFYDPTPGCCVDDLGCDDKLDCTVDSCKKADGAQKTDAGQCQNKPDANNSLCCQPANLFKDHFDSGLTGWTHTNVSKQATWHHTSKDDAGSGKGSLCFGNANCDSYEDKTLKKVDATLCSKAIDIKAGTQYDTLKFQLKLQTEWCAGDPAAYKNPPCPKGATCSPDDQKIDHLSVKLKIGGKFEQIWSSDVVKGCTKDKWLPMNVSLDKWQGKKASVCFQFEIGDSFANDKGGVLIDDVMVDVACNETVCTEKTVGIDCPDKACHTKSCSSDGTECLYDKIPGCCQAKADCDDGDPCTTETCSKDKKCEYKTDDPKCCKVDKTGDKAILAQDFETKSSGVLPAGWKFKCLSGAPGLPGQQYACDASSNKLPKWYVSTAKSSSGPPNVKSLHFGVSGGLLNVKDKAPAGAIESPEVMIPAVGTTLISFDLLTKTEWDEPNSVWSSPPPPFAIDQVRVELVDVKAQQADLTKGIEKIWDSYEIGGGTKGTWKYILIKVPAKSAGKAVRLRLVFDSGSSLKNQVEGVFVDNVRMESVCATPACVANKDCPLAGKKPDECLDYFCAKDDKGTFACQSQFKTGDDAPKNCCKPGLLLPLETAEGQSLNKWLGDGGKDVVRWQVVPHKHLFDKFEIYFGNPAAWNYAAGSAKSCKATSECGSGEACTGEPAKKVCLKAVEGKLTSAVFDLSTSPKEGVELGFHVWADIEPSFEEFEIWALKATGAPIEKVWDHKTALVPKGQLKKVTPQKVDLTKFKSQGQIKLEFRFDSVDGNKNNLFGGIHIDNLRVDQICLQ